VSFRFFHAWRYSGLYVSRILYALYRPEKEREKCSRDHSAKECGEKSEKTKKRFTGDLGGYTLISFLICNENSIENLGFRVVEAVKS
jgi:hypothetical protein